MNKISIAIPTFYSSEFISDCIKSLVNYSVVSEIVVCDDSEDLKEFNTLERNIKNITKETSIDIKISKNNKNLGGFKNKYNCVEKTTNEYVYQIDSDNISNPKFLRYISNINFETLDQSLLFLPSKIYLFNQHKYQSFIKPSNNVTYLKNTKIMNAVDIQRVLIDNKKFVKDKNFGWLLNTGNPFFNKKSYLENLAPGLEDSKNISAACSIALVYFWLKSGNSICISDFLSHYHRVRDDSYYVSQGDTAINSIDTFKERIKNL